MMTPPSNPTRNSVVDLVVQRVLTGTLLALAASLIAVALHLA
jgi:hypothetical protein